jgi:uncharacterized protein
MKQYFWIIFSCLAFAQPAVAELPSRASVEKLLIITNVEKRIDSQYSTMLPTLKQIFRKLTPLGGNNIYSDKIFNTTLPKMVALFREEMGWKAFKEDYIKLYITSFSQAEINSLIDFYESPSGKSFLEKLPLITQKSDEISQQKMDLLYPKINQIIKESLEEFRIKSKDGKN